MLDPIYLDHAATTPVLPDVLEAMMPFFGPRFGNPSSTHRWGREARTALDQLLGPLAGEYEVEFTEQVSGNSSPADSPLAEAIAASLVRLDPEATLVPIVMSGFSDSHWFRKAFGTATVYGFCPQRRLGLFDAAPLMHGADERAAVEDVTMATSFYADLCKRVLQ